MSAVILGSVAVAAYFATSRYACSADVETHLHAHAAPNNWLEALYLFAEALRYSFRETFGKWRTGDLLLGLAYLARKEQKSHSLLQNYQQTHRVCAETLETDARCARREELESILRDMRICMVTRYRKLENRLAKLEELGFPRDAVLLNQGKSAILKPLFVILKDESRRTLILLIRGTTSIKDIFTSFSGTSKPHHMIDDRGVVLGYSHFGMLAGARWIYKQARPVLDEFLSEHEDWQLRLVGHSLGGGTAALLCMMCALTEPCKHAGHSVDVSLHGPWFREIPGSPCSRATALAAACPSCMTLELAQSCAPYVTSIVNATDLVPCMNEVTLEQLRQEVLESAWFESFRRDMRSSSLLYRAAEGSIRAVGVGTYWTGWGLYKATRATGSLFNACVSRRQRQVPYRVDDAALDGGATSASAGISKPVQRGAADRAALDSVPEQACASASQPLPTLDDRSQTFSGFVDEADAASPRSGLLDDSRKEASHALADADLERFDMLEAMLDKEERADALRLSELPKRVLSEDTYARMHVAALEMATAVRSRRTESAHASAAGRQSSGSSSSGPEGTTLLPPEADHMPHKAGDSDSESEGGDVEEGLGSVDFAQGLARDISEYQRECDRAAAGFDDSQLAMKRPRHMPDRATSHSGRRASLEFKLPQVPPDAGHAADEDRLRAQAVVDKLAHASGSDALHSPRGETRSRRRLFPAGRVLHMLPVNMLESMPEGTEAGMRGQAATTDGDDGMIATHCTPSTSNAVVGADSHVDAISHRDTTETSTDSEGLEGSAVEQAVVAAARYTLLEHVPHEAYSRIVLCRTMLADHYLSQYLAALQSVLSTFL